MSAGVDDTRERKQVATVKVATARIIAAAHIIPLYSPHGACVNPYQGCELMGAEG